MFRIDLRSAPQRFLNKVPAKDFHAIINSIKALEQLPRPRGIEKVIDSGLWRIRQGDYRIIYYIDDERKIITVVRIGHRREVYRHL